MPGKYIAIEGNIGAGKTTLARLVANAIGAKLVLEEFADNNFLPKFYKDRERWAFPLELSFLADRYKQLKEFVNTPELFDQPVVTDYLFVKSKLFAGINLDQPEFDLFLKIFEVMDLHIRQPDVLLYLYAPVEVLQAHIRMRGRIYESAIGDDYLRQVAGAYDVYLKCVRAPVIIVDTSKTNFSGDHNSLKALLQLTIGALVPKIYIFNAS